VTIFPSTNSGIAFIIEETYPGNCRTFARNVRGKINKSERNWKTGRENWGKLVKNVENGRRVETPGQFLSDTKDKSRVHRFHPWTSLLI